MAGAGKAEGWGSSWGAVIPVLNLSSKLDDLVPLWGVLAPAMGQGMGIKGDVVPVRGHSLKDTACGWKGRCLASRNGSLLPCRAAGLCQCWVPTLGVQALPSCPCPAKSGAGGEQLPPACCSPVLSLGH